MKIFIRILEFLLAVFFKLIYHECYFWPFPFTLANIYQDCSCYRNFTNMFHLIFMLYAFTYNQKKFNQLQIPSQRSLGTWLLVIGIAFQLQIAHFVKVSFTDLFLIHFKTTLEVQFILLMHTIFGDGNTGNWWKMIKVMPIGSH